MTDFYSQNRCVCSTRSHGPLLCAFCLSFHFNDLLQWSMPDAVCMPMILYFIAMEFTYLRLLDVSHNV